jgi:threonine dehydrogenase-like Zn-dependent dehydrogenase
VRAVRYHGFGGPIQIEEIGEPEPGPRDVVVRVGACQIAGDVLKVLAGCGPVRDRANFVFPHVPGYRGVGTVERVGPLVRDLSVGDRVAVNGCVNCGTCDYCLRGLDNLCQQASLLGLDSGRPGSFAELVKAPEWSAFRIADSLSFARATLLPNMALLVHALERARPQPGFSLAVFGCGLVGSCAVPVARAYGAAQIIGVDRDVHALKLARALGATDLIDASWSDPVAAISKLTDGRGVDISVELVGVPETAQAAIGSTSRRGTTLLIGALRDMALSFPDYYNDPIQKEIDVKTCFGKTQRDFAAAVRLEAAGLLDLSIFPIVEHPLESFVEAVHEAASSRSIHVVDVGGGARL